MEPDTTLCARCALPSVFPGIRFDERGECNYCATHDLLADRVTEDARVLRDALRGLIEETAAGDHEYDCMVLYSGGKDSTYMLVNLSREFDLKILAHTLDNGFLSPTTWKNIEHVTKTLGVDLHVSRPDPEFVKSLFRHVLTQEMPYPKEMRALASTLCHSCIGMVLGTSLKIAIEKKIPLLFAGFTPGQIPSISVENFWKVQSCMFLSENSYKDDPVNFLKMIADPIRERFGEEADRYYFADQYVPRGTFVPKMLFPFHAMWQYDERRILEELGGLGWQRPADVDSCSTNCRINSAGIVRFEKRYGFHPYAGELSHLVRQGLLTREEALAQLTRGANTTVAADTEKRLRIYPGDA